MPTHIGARKIKIFTDALFILCFGALLFRMLIFGSEYIDNMPSTPNNFIALLFSIAYLFIVFLLIYTFKKIKSTFITKIANSYISVLFAFAIVFVLQIIIVFTCYSPSGWDPQVLVDTANDLLITQGKTAYDGTYFHQNPNNLFLLGVFRYYFAFLNSFGITNYLPYAALAGAFLVLLSVMFLFLLLKKHYGTTAAWASFLLCVPLTALSPWIIVPYSDTYGMPFAILCFYFYSMFKTSKNNIVKFICVGICGAIIVVGTYIKPYVLLFIPAIIMVETVFVIKARKSKNINKNNEVAFNKKEEIIDFDLPAVAASATVQTKENNIIELSDYKQNKNLKNIIKINYIKIIIIFIMIFSVIITNFVCNAFEQKAVGNMLNAQKAIDESFSLTHYFMMGQSQPHGSYAYEDMLYTMSFKGSEEKTNANLTEAFRRIEEMGFGGYLSFLWRKLSFSWTDGTFFFGREGAFYSGAPPQTDEISQYIHKFYRADGVNYNLTALFNQSQYILLLLLMILGIFYNKNKNSFYIWLARIFTLGMVCFLLIFEARSRYVYHVLPIMYLAAIGGFLFLYDVIKSRIKLMKARK